jgi:hypothetical protein
MNSFRKLISIIESVDDKSGVWYHGSRQNHGFADSHKGENSHTFGEYDSVRYGSFFSDSEEFASLYGEVKAYKISPKKTWGVEGDETYLNGNVLVQFVHYHLDPNNDAPDQDRDLGLDARHVMWGDSQFWHLFEDELGEAFTKWLRRAGYDSVVFEEYHEDDDGNEIGGTTLVALDRNIISGPIDYGRL